MSVMTEAQVRTALAGADLGATTQFCVPAGTIVTPSAKAWLVDQRIDLIVGDRRESKLPQPGAAPEPRSGEPVSALPHFVKPDHFDLPDGTQVAEKPEHLTALAGNVLVEKDHPEIRLRGQLDALEAQTIAAQVVFRRLGLNAGVADLGDVLESVKQIMRACVLGVRLEERSVLGLTAEELRHVSHHPQERFGVPHFFTSVDDGECVVTLNLLRTKVREVELAAYDAFKRPGQEPRRADVIQALNRLSSACYIMMFKAKAGEYR